MPDLDGLLKPDPRIRILRDGPPDPSGECVVYWMQRAQRGTENPALNHAIDLGNALKLPVLAVFGLTAAYPEANRRHYRFLVEGLLDTERDMKARGVSLVVRLGQPHEVAAQVAVEANAALIVGDENPVKVGQFWRKALVEAVKIPIRLVDADVVVPTSLFPKEEFAARTIRPKIHRVWDQYLQPMENPRALAKWGKARPRPQGETIDADSLMDKLKVAGLSELPNYLGGTAEANRRLQRFLTERLPSYATLRNEPTPYYTSELSAHLHFGHISPLTIALAVKAASEPQECIDSFLEELIVRRELAINFVARNPDYDRLQGCPAWALKTLAKHADDPRPVIYSAEQLDAGETGDPLWNAAQKEMVLTGRMHNYLRMYWGKKLLEWSPDPESAFELTLAMNNRYFMCGRNPNGYAGVAWAIGGKHDRPWVERPIFGMIRYMSYESTRKKFDSRGYIDRIKRIERGEKA